MLNISIYTIIVLKNIKFRIEEYGYGWIKIVITKLKI